MTETRLLPEEDKITSFMNNKSTDINTLIPECFVYGVKKIKWKSFASIKWIKTKYLLKYYDLVL